MSKEVLLKTSAHNLRSRSVLWIKWSNSIRGTLVPSVRIILSRLSQLYSLKGIRIILSKLNKTKLQSVRILLSQLKSRPQQVRIILSKPAIPKLNS